jgi:hypothetical protein
MKGYELGRIFGFLMANRVLRSASGAGQRLKTDEAEIAQFWEIQASEEERLFFDAFLGSQGFKLVRYDSFEMEGIPKDQYVYLLVRDGRGDLSPWADSDQAVEAVRCKLEKSLEPKDSARVWLALIWFSMLHLQYPRIARGFSEVSEYQRAVFDKDQLAEAVREALEKQRSIQDAQPSVIREILLSTDKPQIPNRGNRFLAHMESIGHLQKPEAGIYQQTLLAAAGSRWACRGLGLLAEADDEADEIPTPFGQTERAFELAEESEIGQEPEF